MKILMFNGKITENIAFEIGFNSWISCRSVGMNMNIEYRFEGDHKGFFSSFYICGFGFEFNIYDIRHEVDEMNYEMNNIISDILLEKVRELEVKCDGYHTALQEITKADYASNMIVIAQEAINE
jgi:hypothetical protein